MNKVLLKNLCFEDNCGVYGIPASAEEFDPNKTRYLRITDISEDGKLLDSNKKSVSDKNIQKYFLKESDIVFARTGNSTGKAYYHESKNGVLAFAGFLIKYSLDPNKVNPKYLRYYTISNQYKTWVENLSLGSTRGNINAQTFRNCPIDLPDRRQQDLLVSVLSSLDAKIDLNNKINAELEAMAKLLYDYWFVQFDFPDEHGKPYKSSGGKMVYSEVLRREVPVGWEVKPLSEMTDAIMRGISPKYIDEGGICVLNQKCIRDKSINFELGRRHNHQLKSATNKLIQYGDVLVNSTGVGTLGRVAVVKRLPTPLITVDSHVTIVRADSGKIGPLFLGFSLAERQIEIESFARGSTGQTELSRIDLGTLSMIIPPSDLQLKFHNFIEPQFQKMANNEQQNQQLTELRDWLLPMLMNGQVKVGS